ncbi:hypothetical protein RB195_008952 [Necator americanus]|uniref:Reverse transcriptase domain-containing protein n=1 Tax=Necator americanus TaxID=51031 RepID=A0ABR1CST6_NECAM
MALIQKNICCRQRTRKEVVYDDCELEDSLSQGDWHIEEDPTGLRYAAQRITNLCRLTLNEAQPQEQAGFRQGFSCLDHNQTVLRVVEVCREYRLPLLLTFVDHEKAFDSVETNAILSALVDHVVDATEERKDVGNDVKQIVKRDIDKDYSVDHNPTAGDKTEEDEDDPMRTKGNDDDNMIPEGDVRTRASVVVGGTCQKVDKKYNCAEEDVVPVFQINRRALSLHDEKRWQLREIFGKASSAFHSLTKYLWSTPNANKDKLRAYLPAIRPLMMDRIPLHRRR